MDIYILDLNNFDTALLASEFCEKNFVSELKQKQHLAGRYILKIFANKHNISDPTIVYKKEKPYYKSGEYFFSISHSENLVVVGFEKFEIGLDIENNSKKRDFVKLIKRFDFNLANSILDKTIDEQQRIFYEFWTKYEAKIKLNALDEDINYITQNVNLTVKRKK